MELKYSKRPKSDDKIIKAISREEELQRNDGKWIATHKIHKSKKDYNRKKGKMELRRDLGSICFIA